MCRHRLLYVTLLLLQSTRALDMQPFTWKALAEAERHGSTVSSPVKEVDDQQAVTGRESPSKTSADQTHRQDTAPGTPHRASVICGMLFFSLLAILLSWLGGKQQGAELLQFKESAQRSKAACDTAECALKTVQEQLHRAEKELDSYRAAQATCTAALSPLADNAKLLPWSPAMAPLFIDPSKLNQGSLLGLGSSGAQTYTGTYSQTDTSQPTQVALKVLPMPGQAGMGGLEERVRLLWQASADSHHICRIYGVSCLSGQACLVMKLYPQSLAQDISSTSGAKRSLPMRVVIQRSVDICRGMQDLHAAGIIMMSLCQANVFITSSGTCVLADCVLTQHYLEGDDHHTTFGYKLPEMSDGHAAITCKAGIYALGCLLVEMYTGEPWASGILTLKVFGPQGDDAESMFVNIVRRCLCEAPDGRPTAAEVQQVRLLVQGMALSFVQLFCLVVMLPQTLPVASQIKPDPCKEHSCKISFCVSCSGCRSTAD
ncbi:hypothetical protein ABBQ38_008234 [Trebouxia sp. C0009 RCD-2024]